MVKLRKIFAIGIFTVCFLASSIISFASDNKVVAYYFHSNLRCPTCRAMEKYTKEAIEGNFKDDLASGRLVFKAINIDAKGNAHYINDYQLYTKSLVVSKVVDDKEVEYKNLAKIWEYARNKDKFLDYVTSEIKDYLKE